MHLGAITLHPKLPISHSNHGFFLQSPRPTLSVFPPLYRTHSIFNRTQFLQISQYTSSSNSKCLNGSYSDLKSRSIALKDVDVATLGNLCVDIVLNVPELPPSNTVERKAYMDRLAESNPDKQYWEGGGNCNTVIAAARLGLNCIAIGHVGSEMYGQFLLDVLNDEGIRMIGMSEDVDIIQSYGSLYETLLCWVLVDPLQRHGFCSRADFSKEPAFSWIKKLPAEVKMAIKQSKVLFVNGYGFDELSPSLIVSALDHAIEVGTAIFFDPGPRGKSLSVGIPEEQRALNQYLKMSDVLLLTSDETESLTGIGNPVLAGQELLKQGVRTKWVIVKMGAKGSILITTSSVSCAPAFKVNVVDTVGCGDSFVAAIVFGFIRGMQLINTLAIANAVGAATAMGCGAGRNVATLERVVELLRASNLNDDDDAFWNKILGESMDVQEVTFLSKIIINGSYNGRKHLPLQNVVSELLPSLDACLEQQVPS